MKKVKNDKRASQPMLKSVVAHRVKAEYKKNPAIKDWISENKKNARGCFNCSENISHAQNGCELIENGYRFVIS